MYALKLATLPLNKSLLCNVIHIWYADDSCGSLAQLYQWWEWLSKLGPGYQYFVSARKTCLLTKSLFQSTAVAQFTGTGMNVTCESQPYPGAAIGIQEYTRKFMED